jgi:membrane protease YdiL (CAAX protease family)
MGREYFSNQRFRRLELTLFFTLVLLFICDVWLFKTAGWARLAAAIFAYAGLFLIYKFSGLSLSDVGLEKSKLKSGLFLALKIIAVYCVFLLLAYLFARGFFKDPRYNHPITTAVYSSLVILPVKTIIFEELVFRGLIAGIFNRLRNFKTAIVGSSLLFGVWHVTTAGGLNSNLESNGVALSNSMILIFIFFVTAAAGAALCYVRYKCESLVAPIALHWFINASAIILAAISWSS